MTSIRFSAFLLAATLGFRLSAQGVFPITRFHSHTSSYVRYDNQFLSGFMQTASKDSLNGVLQMPYIGRPVWVYVGEKDSTQYMAFASGYQNMKYDSVAQQCEVKLSRYGVKADVELSGNVLVQRYAYPDTIAEKGFLVDLDHALNGTSDYDMDIKMLDRHTIRAYRRPYGSSTQLKPLYYYARFSHPYESYNIRRETVRKENGEREQRLKAAFTFLLKANEDLIVTSAVSASNADRAYAMVEGHSPKTPIYDAPIARPTDENLLAGVDDQSKRRMGQDEARLPAARQTRSLKPASSQVNRNKRSSSVQNSAIQTGARAQGTNSLIDGIEVETREAVLRTAFDAALGQLLGLPQMKRVKNMPDLMNRLTALARNSAYNDCDAMKMDSLLRAYAAGCLEGTSLQQDADGYQAAWFVLQSVGLSPVPSADSRQGEYSQSSVVGENAYRLCRPLFNVVTFYYPGNRRFILHAKSNSPVNKKVIQASWNGQRMQKDDVLTLSQLLRGGVLAVRMGK